MNVRQLLSAAVVSGGLALAGCGSGSDLTGPTNGSAPSVAGSYDLQTLNGQSLPAVLFQDSQGGTIEVVESNLLIRADGNFVFDGVVRVTAAGQSEILSDVDTGTWVQSGSAISLVWDGGGCTDVGTASGSRILFSDDCVWGADWEYEK